MLAQPVAESQKAQAFVPLSIEIGQDWASIHAEMGRLFADAKKTLESTAFLTGTGTNEPWGILSGATTVVTGSGSGTFAVADVYSLVQALPARFQDNAVVAANPTTYDEWYRLVGGGSTEPPVLPTHEGPVLGRRKFAWSSMSTLTASGTKRAVVGDWSHYLIADRVGLSVELIPHLFGAANRFPIGARGLYCYWRTATSVLTANAFRVLIKP